MVTVGTKSHMYRLPLLIRPPFGNSKSCLIREVTSREGFVVCFLKAGLIRGMASGEGGHYYGGSV